MAWSVCTKVFPFDISLVLRRVSKLVWGKNPYLFHWSLFESRSYNCTWLVRVGLKSDPMAMQPATASQISSLQRRTPFFADSSLMPGSAVEMSQAAGLGPLAATSLQTRFFSFQRATPPLAPSHFLPPRDLWGKNSGLEYLSSRWQASSHRLNARLPRHHHRESSRLSSTPSTISVPLRLLATWSRSVWVTMNWMTAFLWRLQTLVPLLPRSTRRAHEIVARQSKSFWAKIITKKEPKT